MEPNHPAGIVSGLPHCCNEMVPNICKLNHIDMSESSWMLPIGIVFVNGVFPRCFFFSRSVSPQTSLKKIYVMSFPYSDVREVTLTPCNMFDVSVPHFWREKWLVDELGIAPFFFEGSPKKRQRPREGAVGSDFKIERLLYLAQRGDSHLGHNDGFSHGIFCPWWSKLPIGDGKNFAGDETDLGWSMMISISGMAKASDLWLWETLGVSNLLHKFFVLVGALRAMTQVCRKQKIGSQEKIEETQIHWFSIGFP